MTAEAILPETSAPAQRRDLRGYLLLASMAVGLIPALGFVFSMFWYRGYLGDWNVFWGIETAPLEWVYGHYLPVFPYPPTGLMLFRPFGLLPFWPSLLAWSAAGATAMAFASRRMLSRGALAMGFCTNAMIGVLLGGQTSLFVGALIIGGLTTQNPRWRGVLLATAAVIKPQSLLAAPIALIAERNWRAIAWVIATTLTLALLSLAAFGLETWTRWLAELPKFHAWLIDHGIDRRDVGAYGLVRAVGLPGWLFVIAIPPALVTSWSVFRTETPIIDRYAAFACCTVMMSPYTLSYDLAGLSLACVAMLMDRKRSPLIWVAAALILSTIFANLGIVLMTGMLGYEALNRLRAEKLGVSISDTSSAAVSPR
ncbi:hypothetical protein GCM10022276_23820 [Sphingomonas limnosediminicola]|uniref:DUF2029 domain-containing protein n=1 Tax=Sphingomonas limnosediminicola TaxID=940133 RepID=A0ABP7LLT4_9SPHN